MKGRRPQLRDKVKAIPTLPLRTGKGKVMFLKVTMGGDGKVTLGGMKHSKVSGVGVLVQDSDSREIFENNSTLVTSYFGEAVEHLRRSV